MIKLKAIISLIFAENWFVAISHNHSHEVASGCRDRQHYSNPLSDWQASGKVEGNTSSINYSVTIKNEQ